MQDFAPQIAAFILGLFYFSFHTAPDRLFYKPHYIFINEF